MYDLFLDIETWVPPERIIQLLNDKGISLKPCTPGQFNALKDFEDIEFGIYPGWLEKYEALKDTDGK